jgi:hypothetical protein
VHNRLHLDFTNITPDGRLSSKDIMTRKFIFEVHSQLSQTLYEHGYNIERGETTPKYRRRALSVEEYKKYAEKKRLEIQKHISSLKEEYDLLSRMNDELSKGNDELAELILLEQKEQEDLIR